MEWYDWLSVVAAFVSIGMAVLSVGSFCATREAKMEVMKRLDLSQLSRHEEVHKGILSELRKVAHQSSLPRGFNLSETVKKINLYYEELSRIISNINEGYEAEVRQDLNCIQNSMNKLGVLNRTDKQEIITEFSNIYSLVISIESSLNRAKSSIVSA